MYRVGRISKNVSHKCIEYSGGIIDGPIGRWRRGKEEAWEGRDHDVVGYTFPSSALPRLGQGYDHRKKFMERACAIYLISLISPRTLRREITWPSVEQDHRNGIWVLGLFVHEMHCLSFDDRSELVDSVHQVYEMRCISRKCQQH
jgi:hypothetical protein